MFIENTEELAQNKLLLLYIIDKSKKPFTNEGLTEFILEKNYMNYFLVQQYLSELLNSGFIQFVDFKGDKVYKLLEKGKITLSYFEERIDQDIKNEILKEFGIDLEYQPKKEVIGEYFKRKEHEYVVNLKLKENDINLISLYINLPNENQAKTICEKWHNNTEEIYKNILNSVLDEELL